MSTSPIRNRTYHTYHHHDCKSDYINGHTDAVTEKVSHKFYLRIRAVYESENYCVGAMGRWVSRLFESYDIAFQTVTSRYPHVRI